MQLNQVNIKYEISILLSILFPFVQIIVRNGLFLEFSKLTLATSKFVAIESVNEEKGANIQALETVKCSTTTATTTMTKVINEPPNEDDNEDVSCAQKQKILLYESTRDENQSDILTNDDTGSLCSSIDSKELEAGLKEITQPTQNTIANIQRIDTQLQNLSFVSPSKCNDVTTKSDESLQNMSHQFHQLSMQHDKSDCDKDKTNVTTEENVKTIFSNSVQTLSSNDTLDQEPEKSSEEKCDSDSIIVLSDSEPEEAGTVAEVSKRIISQEPPRKPSSPSSNDPGVYNLSPIDQSSLQKVNNFFDNAPFIEPAEPIENSFSSSHISKSTKEDIFIPETSDEESVVDCSIVESSLNAAPEQKTKPEPKEQPPVINLESDKPELSDNNIIVDIPVVKSTSDQPRQVIRSQSGVRLTASHSSPIYKNASKIIGSEGVKRTPSNVVLTPSGIRFNSSNGQVNIAAKININIQIVEDSSEESSEDNNKPSRKSQAIQPTEECSSSSDIQTNTKFDDSYKTAAKSSQSKCQNEPTNNQTPKKGVKSAADGTPSKTPQTASKLKQFEFVPPKSMTKSKNQNKETEGCEINSANKSITSEGSENDGFQIDKNIPISPRDQKLLVSEIYF